MSDKKLDEPKMVFEFVLPATALVSGSKFAYDVRKDMSVAQKPEEPLFVSVIGTRTINDKHELVIEVKNLGVHGVYLEAIESKDPKDVNVLTYFHVKNADKHEVFEEKPMGMGVGHPQFGKPILPTFLSPQNSQYLKVEFDKFNLERIESKPYGKLTLKYTVAGVAKSGLEIAIPFSIRL